MKRVNVVVESLFMSKQSYLCYNCNHKNNLKAYFCVQCKIVQPPLKLNHFARLNQKISFDIDLNQLEKSYLDLQKLLHPDLFSQKSKIEENFAFKHSLLINQAYNILINPLKRSEYLLSLHDVQVNNNHEKAIQPDKNLLAEIFELQMELEELEDIEEKNNFFAKIEQEISKIGAKIAKNYQEKKLDIMANLTIKLRYLNKLKELQ
jgi:molecular chaperone HscB